MTAIHVTHVPNSRNHVAVGRHGLTVDQPETAGGDDQGPTAVQLFAASMVACTAHYASSYLTRNGLSTEGLVVEGDVVMADDSPARIASLSVTIAPSAGLSESRQAGLLAVASHCTVHNTLRQPPIVDIGLSGRPSPTASGYVASPSCGNGALHRSAAVGMGLFRSSSQGTDSAGEPTEASQ